MFVANDMKWGLCFSTCCHFGGSFISIFLQNVVLLNAPRGTFEAEIKQVPAEMDIYKYGSHPMLGRVQGHPRGNQHRPSPQENPISGMIRRQWNHLWPDTGL